jgi:hypothetical protein
MKAKFNVGEIVNGKTIYPEDFVNLVKKYKDIILEVSEEPFGGYELELEGSIYGLYDEELIIIND